jgi:hypothetical protein
MDWQRRVPNIAFMIIPSTGETYLQLSSKDSSEKDTLFKELLEPHFLFDNWDASLYLKTIPMIQGVDYLQSLEHFLKIEKQEIDKIISNNRKLFETKQIHKK